MLPCCEVRLLATPLILIIDILFFLFMFTFKKKKVLLNKYRQARREYNALLSIHNSLHPELNGRGHEFEKYTFTWKRLCELRDIIYNIALCLNCQNKSYLS